MIFIELPEETYKVQTKIIVVDFTKGKEIFDKIEEKIKKLEIGILVNNVGMLHKKPEYFLALTKNKKYYYDMIHCNSISVVQMTRIILPQMVERQKGLIINIASQTAVLSGHLCAVYGGTKAFVSKFTYDLRSEYKKYGITIQTVCHW
jgi:17beta-estradiol 17-dehydrogenase / very-long-chain 3-oxoacyl-CoA reductase